jgi:hypothetical protein
MRTLQFVAIGTGTNSYWDCLNQIEANRGWEAEECYKGSDCGDWNDEEECLAMR